MNIPPNPEDPLNPDDLLNPDDPLNPGDLLTPEDPINSMNSEAVKHRHLGTLQELREFTESSFLQCKQKLQLYTRDLDPRILNSRNLERLISRFIRSSRFARVEILIIDEKNLQGIDHRLVSLAQNYSSYIQIRVIPKDYHENYFAYYLIDGRTILYRRLADRFECEYQQLPSSLVKQKSKYFDEVWQISTPASHLRALHL